MLEISVTLGKCTQRLSVQRVLFEHELCSVTITTLKKQVTDLFNNQEVHLIVDSYSAVNKLRELDVEVTVYET